VMPGEWEEVLLALPHQEGAWKAPVRLRPGPELPEAVWRLEQCLLRRLALLLS